MANEPVPLTPEQRHVLGWDAATDRLVESAKVTVRESRRRRRELDEVGVFRQAKKGGQLKAKRRCYFLTSWRMITVRNHERLSLGVLGVAASLLVAQARETATLL